MCFKISTISTILVLLLVSTTGTIYTESPYSQSFEDTKTIKTYTNYALSAPSITSDKYNSVAEIVLLNQILTEQSHGYRFLVGEIKNIGNDTAESVQILLSVYDKMAI